MKPWFVVALLAVAGFVGVARAQFQFPYPGLKYSKGQDVSPTFDGWEANADGTFTFYYGYYNRNTEEEIDVPVGEGNHFDRNADEGQPAHFYTGRRWFVFKVNVPADWPKDKRLVWTLTSNGRTDLAKGWLQPEWEVDKALITKNAVTDRMIGIWETSPPHENKEPSITGGGAQTITFPATATLTATASDDGLPKPKGTGRGGRPQGLQIRWILYRGQSGVKFDPEVSPAVYGKPNRSETKVTFPAPGDYRLRAIACDGSLFSTYDVDVHVNAAQ